MKSVKRESHLMAAEKTNPDLIRAVLGNLPTAPSIQVPPGHVAIPRDRVVHAGLDTLAVTRWLQPLGGFGAVAYLRPTSHKHADDVCRPALHPVSYFSVPVEALQQPAEEKSKPGEAAVA
jgi:hypothetical protein